MDPTPPLWSRRAFLGATGVAVAAPWVGACGTDPTGGAARSRGAAASAGFPVTVPGKPEPVTVPAKPRRVVAVGFERDTDTALALDAPLVGAVKNVSFASGLAPWQKLPAGATLLARSQRLPYEKIVALRPDLILAADDYTIADDYAQLSRIAPTLGYEKEVGSDDWASMTTRIGAALGERDKAEAVVTGVQRAVADAVSTHPELRGLTFTFGPVSAESLFVINRDADSAVSFFAEFGMRVAPQVLGLKESSTPNRASISRERLDLLDADVVLLTFEDDAARRQLEGSPLFQRLPAVRRGSYVPLDTGAALALAFPSAAAIPYGLTTLVPQLSKAAAAVRSGAGLDGP